VLPQYIALEKVLFKLNFLEFVDPALLSY